MVPSPPRAVLAVRVVAAGPTSGLRQCQVDRPSAGPGEVLVEVRSAAVNRSDVLSVQGLLPMTRFPRVPGRDFAGVVVEGPSEWMGTEVCYSPDDAAAAYREVEEGTATGRVLILPGS